MERPVKINRSYDIPYLAGYSEDGKTVYFDRRFKPIMPKSKVDTIKFLLFHEKAEKAIINLFKFRYHDAHEIATYLEHKEVEASGLDWKVYSTFLEPYIHKTDREVIRKIPYDLDTKPYRDEHDVKHIRAMKKLAQGRRLQPSTDVNKNVIDSIKPIGTTDKITDK
jgi:hypothetical protein